MDERNKREAPAQTTTIREAGLPNPPDIPGDLSDAVPRNESRRTLRFLGTLIATLLALLLIWQLSPLKELLDPEFLAARLDAVAARPWAPIALLASYLLSALVMFPVTILIALTAITFGAWPGTLYAVVGSLSSAALTYYLGALAGKRSLNSLMGPRMDRISRALAKRGIISVAAFRLVPIAPYTLINMAAGASHIRFVDYLLGTFLGMLPGILIMTALGDQLRDLWENPSLESLSLLTIIFLVWIALSLLLQRLLARIRN